MYSPSSIFAHFVLLNGVLATTDVIEANEAVVTSLYRRQGDNAIASPCKIASNYISQCKSYSPGWESKPATERAACVCYTLSSSTPIWIPQFFDDNVRACLSEMSSTDPSLVESLELHSNLCSIAGNVVSAAFTNAITTASGSIPASSLPYKIPTTPLPRVTSAPLTSEQPIPPPSTTPSPESAPGSSSCNRITYSTNSCTSVRPDLNNLEASDLAECLCYNKYYRWQPEGFDEIAKVCLHFATTAMPETFQRLKAFEGFCLSMGDILADNTGVSSSQGLAFPTISPSRNSSTVNQQSPKSQIDPRTYAPCQRVSSALSSCSSLTPHFSEVPASKQASCLCYTTPSSMAPSTSTWDPQQFDQAAYSCAEMVKTAAPEDYGFVGALAGLCGRIGDVVIRENSSNGEAGMFESIKVWKVAVVILIIGRVIE